MLVNDTIFINNTAIQSGGAVYVVQEQSESGGYVQLSDCVLQSNKVGRNMHLLQPLHTKLVCVTPAGYVLKRD